MRNIGEKRLHEYITDEKGHVFIDVGSIFQVYGKYYKTMLDGGWGCDGCGLNGKCSTARRVFGSCEGSLRPDGNDVIFADLGANPFR